MVHSGGVAQCLTIVRRRRDEIGAWLADASLFGEFHEADPIARAKHEGAAEALDEVIASIERLAGTPI